jgi:hypothetical protein
MDRSFGFRNGGFPRDAGAELTEHTARVGLLGQKLLASLAGCVKGGNKRDSKRALEEEKQWVALLLGEREKSLFEKIDAFERDKSDLT